MSDEEKKDQEEPAKPTAWEDSHTAASLPSWWRPDEEPTQPTPVQKPAAPPPMQPASAPQPPPPAPTPPAAAPTETPVNWDVSTTAKELPTWWRPEQAPATPAQHASPTVPPVPHEAMPPAMPATPPPMQPMAAPPPEAPPMQPMAATPPPAPPMTAPTPPMAPMATTPPEAPASPTSMTPPPSSSPPSRHERTMVLGVMPAAGPPMAILVVRSGPDMGFKFRLKPMGIAHVGRDLECDVVLDDPASSRHHATIEFKDGAYTLTDLGSANGTMVNDQRVSVHRLVDGDRILVGQDEIVISIM